MENSKREELWRAVHKTNRIMTAFHKIAAMPPQAVGALKCIKHCSEMHDGKAKTSVIAENMFLSRPATTHLINDLENRGYVERIMTNADRRVVYLKLTQIGEDELVKGEADMMLFFNRLMDNLGEEDVDELIRLQNKLSNIVLKMEEEQKTQFNSATRKEEGNL